MELAGYVDELRRHLIVAAEAGGDEARPVAERLLASLDASVRLVLLAALSDAAGEITLELAPGSVDVRLRGREPELVVTPPPTEPTLGAAGAPAPPEGDEGGTARLTLRLPEHVKTRVEAAAARQGISVNAWLARAATAALDRGGDDQPSRRVPSVSANRITGWAR